MSETVHYKGKLIKLYHDSLTLRQQLNIELNNVDIEFIVQNEDDIEEALELLSEFGYNYYVHKDNLYLVKREKLDSYSVSSAYQINEHEIKFEVMYYNGGMCFDEALEMALKGIE